MGAPATHAATARHSRNQPLPRRNPRIFSRVCTSVCAAPSTVPPVGTVWSPSPSGRGVGVRAPAPTPQRHATRAINRFRARTPKCPAELHVDFRGALDRPSSWHRLEPLSLRERGWGEGIRHPRRNGTSLAQSTASAQEPRMSSRVERRFARHHQPARAMTIVSRRSVAASACSHPFRPARAWRAFHSRTKPCFVALLTRPASAARRCHRRRSC